MLEGLRVSAFLAGRSLRRGNKGTILLTVMIIALVFVNLVFLPSIVQGVVVSFNRQSIDYNYGNLDVEPREGEFYIAGYPGPQGAARADTGGRGRRAADHRRRRDHLQDQDPLPVGDRDEPGRRGPGDPDREPDDRGRVPLGRRHRGRP